ncbi:MAG: inorganic phosphate transporter, partial [Chloroflexi bacterium]|nr:inorganic phosphate transporter [Chloroflexota bacterium]
MPDAALVVLVVTILLALSYAYANGANDAANAVAAVISTRAMRPGTAVAMGAAFNAIGALTGTAVAKMIGKGIVEPSMITEYTVMGAILGSVLWVLLATRVGMPVSVSHSLVASLVGAGLATAGVDAINIGGLTKVLIALALSPILGFILGFLAVTGLFWLIRGRSPSGVRRLFLRLQIIAGAALAYSHGKNDGQNAMGIIALAATFYTGRELSVDLWMVLISSAAIGIGTAIGGSRVIRTMGMRITKLDPVQGFAASTAGAALIEAASQIGLPVSTTHTASGTIMGVGASRRLSAVRWGVTRSIATAWL